MPVFPQRERRPRGNPVTVDPNDAATGNELSALHRWCGIRIAPAGVVASPKESFNKGRPMQTKNCPVCGTEIKDGGVQAKIRGQQVTVCCDQLRERGQGISRRIRSRLQVNGQRTAQAASFPAGVGNGRGGHFCHSIPLAHFDRGELVISPVLLLARRLDPCSRDWSLRTGFVNAGRVLTLRRGGVSFFTAVMP